MPNRLPKDNNDDVSMYYPDGDYENITADDEYLTNQKRNGTITQ